MILNHTGWVVYAVLNTDWFIFSAESTGLLCGIWITFSLYPLSTEKVLAWQHTLVQVLTACCQAKTDCLLQAALSQL